jgi:PHP family Zn ribbon phosphoesterase
MNKGENISGLIYHKMDLHIHTPASDCFRDKSVTPEDIINKSLKEGLAAIAITDHNSGMWIDDIKKAAKNRINIFPGVEISATGGVEGTIHIVAIFDKDKSSKDVENLLGDLKIYPEKYGKPDAYTTDSPSKVIDKIAAHGALAIVAHANSSKGVMGGMRGNPRYGVIENSNLSAVEATAGDFTSVEKRKNGKRIIDLLDGDHPEYRKLAVYQVSDNRDENTGNHRLSKIGTYYSHFKLDEVTLEGLRQCFCDPDVRIKQKDDFKLTKLPKLVKMEISEGFLSDQEVYFHRGLNSIVGGKGTGKSLIVEFLRFAMNQTSQDKDVFGDHNKKLEKRLEPFGKITVDFELSTGETYRIL